MTRLGNYLRTYRRQWQLTQEELAVLYGYSDQSVIAKLEHDERGITFAVGCASELLFGVDFKDVFPAAFKNVEERLLKRLHDLHERILQADPTQRNLKKLELLRDALTRLMPGSEIEV